MYLRMNLPAADVSPHLAFLQQVKTIRSLLTLLGLFWHCRSLLTLSSPGLLATGFPLLFHLLSSLFFCHQQPTWSSHGLLANFFSFFQGLEFAFVCVFVLKQSVPGRVRPRPQQVELLCMEKNKKNHKQKRNRRCQEGYIRACSRLSCWHASCLARFV